LDDERSGSRAAGLSAGRRSPAAKGLPILIALLIGVGIGALLTTPRPTSIASSSTAAPSALSASGSTAPTPTSATPTSAPEDRKLTFRDQGLQLVVPAGWDVDADVPRSVVRVADPSSDASLAVSHTSLLRAVVCDPVCIKINLPQFVPQREERTLDGLARAITKRTGSSRWNDLDPTGLRIGDARALTVPAARDATFERSYVIGHYANGLVVAVAELPAGPDRAGRLRSLLEGIRPFPSEIYPTGEPVAYRNMALGISVDVPNVWSLDVPRLAAGTRTFGGGRLRISVADAAGVLTLCDPVCRSVFADDLGELERRVFAPTRSGIEVGDTTLSGARARYRLDRTTVSPSYQVIAIVNGRPVQLWLDLAYPGVEMSAIDDIVASFRYVRPTRNRIVHGALIGPGFKVRLPEGWGTGLDYPGTWRRRPPTVTVSVGDDLGHVWVCRWSYWSRDIPCAIRQGSTLSGLMKVTGARSWGRSTDVLLDGEPAIVVSGIAAYEYPAAGGQYLAYVFSVHDGRPYVIRLWNPATTDVQIREVLDAFRFTD
jgi:hypothetical protein